MKKVSFVLLIAVFFMVSNSVNAQKKSPCLFDGTVNGVKVRSFEGQIDHSAGPAYLILSLKIGGDFWMMDLTGVNKKPGNAPFALVLKKHDGKKFSEHYSGQAAQNVIQNKKIPVQFGIFNSSFIVKDSKGKTILVKGNFLWDTSRFPK
jgi:hypothetical protein